MGNYNFYKDLIQIMHKSYAKSNSAVLLNSQLGELFRTTVGVRQGCPLSPFLFNIFHENIMLETLQDFNTTISIGGRPIYNLRFVDTVLTLQEAGSGSESELHDLTTTLEEKARVYGMEVSSEKCKILKQRWHLNKGNQNTDCSGHVCYVKTSHWKSRNINFKTKLKLYIALAVYILFYVCESWTLTVET